MFVIYNQFYMKILQTLFLLFIVSSCTTIEDYNLELDSKISYEYLSTLSSEEQKVLYLDFSTEDKIKYRKKIINDFIDNYDLTEEQNSLIMELRSYLTKKTFEDREYLNQIHNNEIQVWYSRAIKELSPAAINHIATGPILPVTEGVMMRFARDCSCNVGSMFMCTTERTVGAIGPVLTIEEKRVPCEKARDIGCELEMNQNSDGTESISLGCGFFGIFECNGGC